MVDARVLWVAGSGATLRRSIDGGATWQNVAPADSAGCDFRDVHAFSAASAVAMVAGQPARVYRTADGGASWQIVHHDPDPAAFFDAIAFDGDQGYLVGDPQRGAFQVLRSDDRGRTWRALAGPQALPGEAAFAASGSCLDASAGLVRIVTGGSVARLLSSRDGGATWMAVALPLQQGTESQGAFGFACTGCDCVVVGGDYRAPATAAGTVARSVDCGTFWSSHGEQGALGFRSAAAWLDATTVLAVGETGASLSLDRGAHWQPFGSAGFHAIVRGSDGSVFACGGGGRVARLQLP